jgi:hypothetical protein
MYYYIVGQNQSKNRLKITAKTLDRKPLCKFLAVYIDGSKMRQKLRILTHTDTPTTAKNYPYFSQIGLINLKKRHKLLIS